VDRELLLAVGGRAYRDFLTLAEGQRLTGAGDGDQRRGDMVRFEQRHVLRPQPLSVHQLAARLEAGGFELADQIVDRLCLGRGGHAAPFERVRAERLVMRREPGRVEGEGSRGGSARKQQGGNGQGSERDAQGGKLRERFKSGECLEPASVPVKEASLP